MNNIINLPDGINITELIKPDFNDKAYMDFFQDNEENKPIKLYPLLTNFAFNPTLLHFNIHYLALGCNVVMDSFTLYPNIINELDLSNKINGGKLIFISYTPVNGKLRPIELHGNCPEKNISNPHKFFIPYAENIQDSQPTVINYIYVYAPKELLNDIFFSQFLDVFADFSNRDFTTAVFKLQIICEYTLKKFIAIYNPKTSYKNYSNRLKALPEILAELGSISCPDFIIDELNAMRITRNQIIHDGGIKTISEQEMIHWIVASLLFYKYFKIVHNIEITK